MKCGNSIVYRGLTLKQAGMLKKYLISLPDLKTILPLTYQTALMNKTLSLHIPNDTGY